MRGTQFGLTSVMIGFVAYLLSPIFFWFYLVSELESGAFPVNADSIGIPMAGFLLAWIAGLVFLIVAYVVWASTKNESMARENQEQNAASGVK